MSKTLSPAKATLLAVHLAASADIDSLRCHAATYAHELRKDVILRILLTHLPETLAPEAYTSLLQQIDDDTLGSVEHTTESQNPTQSTVTNLTEDEAIAKLRKLHLLDLRHPQSLWTGEDDPLALFLYHRSIKLDQDAGLLHYVPQLLVPFLQRCPQLRTWYSSTILPLNRRNYVYYPATSKPLSVLQFQSLPDHDAATYLLSETGRRDEGLDNFGRDLRGILGPWLHNHTRWSSAGSTWRAVGWCQLLQWVTSRAAQSWVVPVRTLEQWPGLHDVDIGAEDSAYLDSEILESTRLSYLQAMLAAAYTVSEDSHAAHKGVFFIATTIRAMVVPGESILELDSATEMLPPMPIAHPKFGSQLSSSPLRQDLLDANNILTSPDERSMTLLQAFTLSSYLLTRFGLGYTARRAAELAYHDDGVEQKNELMKIIRLASNGVSRDDDHFWRRTRRELLWLQSWHPDSETEGMPDRGLLSALPRETIELELLKAMLANSRYELARSLYDGHQEPRPLPERMVHDAVVSSALSAFDNATNPNRTRGGLKKCDEISRAFPQTVPSSSASSKRIQALLQAAHGLASYKIVLKQGEPFSPVILRVHADSISLFEKVLEQNASAYTRIGEFVQMGRDLAVSGFLQNNHRDNPESEASQDQASNIAEKRVVAMCIQAALRADDFETAYSYVISRLGNTSSMYSQENQQQNTVDGWSWRAAFEAGQYVRSPNASQPTHLGTSSGNPEIRHLEQRLECLATALRIAPAEQLLEILKTFRRCEEQLDSAIVEEAAQEEAWDSIADVRNAPGSFDSPVPSRLHPARNLSASASVRQAEESPMSLFDLSRATAAIASRNLTSLSSLRSDVTQATTRNEAEELEEHRVRKRDQFREAATGTLVSGVGWLIGANTNRSE